MNKFRSVALFLALGMSAAWGAESVMTLISNGEAVQKEVLDNKAAYEGANQRKKDLDVEGRQLIADHDKLAQDIVTHKQDEDKVNASIADYKKNCSPDKKLTQDQYTACATQQTQINAEVARVNGELGPMNVRKTTIEDNIAKHNDEIKGIDQKVADAWSAYKASLQKEAAWLDQARTRLSDPSFTSYGKKAGCPDVSKPTKTPEAMIKMSADVIDCLNKVSAGN